MSKAASTQSGAMRPRPVNTKGRASRVCRSPPAADTHTTEEAGASGAMEERAYIIFESRFAQDLFCAVPTSHEIPTFLFGAAWLFRGTLGRRGFRIPGFDKATARTVAQRDGFYLFTSAARRDRG